MRRITPGSGTLPTQPLLQQLTPQQRATMTPVQQAQFMARVQNMQYRHQLQTGATSQQMSGGTLSNVNVRWKPLDSATKTGCQEFARYQMQYNLSQQQQESVQMKHQQEHNTQRPSANYSQQPTNTNSNNRSVHNDPLGLGSLADLADFSKNDLDSLLPSLNPNDLDSALLAFDTKGSSLDSLLDIDLISSLDSNGGNSTSNATTTSGDSQIVRSTPSTTPLSNGPITSSQVQFNQIQSATNNNNNSTNSRNSTQSKDVQRFLINPLTGDMEVTQVEDTSEEDANNMALVGADFLDTYSDQIDNDDDESSRGTNFSTKFPSSDISDTEKSNQSAESVLLQIAANLKTSKKSKTKKDKSVLGDQMKPVKEKVPKARVKKAVLTSVPSPTGSANPELKLRLKLEKTINQAPKKPIASKPSTMVAQQYNFNASIAQQFIQQSSGPVSGSNITAVGNTLSVEQQSTEEPRVPPLHISIKNKSVVIKCSGSGNLTHNKKEKKRFQNVSLT